MTNRVKRLYERIDVLEKGLEAVGFSKGKNFIERSRYMIHEYVESNSPHADEAFDVVDEKVNYWLKTIIEED